MRIAVALLSVVMCAGPSFGAPLVMSCAERYKASSDEVSGFRRLGLYLPGDESILVGSDPPTQCTGSDAAGWDCCRIDMEKLCPVLERINAAGDSRIEIGDCRSAGP